MPTSASPPWRHQVPVPHPQLRVTDVDRDQVVEQVKAAFVEGKLDKDEMEQRLHRAMTARTHADLLPIMGDLYGTQRAYPSRPPAPHSYANVPQWRPAPPVLLSNTDRWGAAAAHLLAVAGLYLIGPLMMLLVAGKTSPYIKKHAVEALNFQLTLLGATLVLPVTIIGVVLLPVIWVAAMVFSLVAGVSATNGKDFRYPLTLRVVK